MTIKEICCKWLWIQLIFLFVVGMFACNAFVYAEDAEDWMPDVNLWQAVREALELPAGEPLTKEKMQGLVVLVANDRGILDITGLEFATNLRKIFIGKNPITDLRPLSNLTQLVEFHFWHIPPNPTNLDLRPLANLINLKVISLEGNGISDISPLAELKKLQRLDLSRNHISDIRPLMRLTELRVLLLEGNPVRDLDPLAGLNITEFHYDEICEIEPLEPPIIQRIQNKNHPAIFQPFGNFSETQEEYDTDWSSDDPELYHKRVARNDLYFSVFFSLDWASDAQPYRGLATRVGGNLELAREWRETQLALNPSLIFLFQVRAQEAPSVLDFPPDSEVWLRDADGEFAGAGDYTFNILRPEVQQLLIDKFVGIAECGLFDGIMLDGFWLNGTAGWRPLYEVMSVVAGREITDEDIIQIYRHILRGVRERVRSDFLILMNTNVTRPDRYAEFVNGSFMETDVHHLTTYKGLQQMEEVLSWNEKNLRAPQINCLEGRALDGPSHSPENLRRMRLATTLSLTHSDGYVDYTTHLYEGARGPRLAPWYGFWDANLGQPIGEKAQRCDNCEGLFIREFTNGWAVYNRSGKPQKIQLPMQATGVESGVTNTTHIVPDLDGEMYLKEETSTVGDGTVKVLELPIAAPQESAAEWMPDTALRAAVREALGLPTIVHLTKEHLLPLDALHVIDKGISDITGLEFATNLKVLYLSKNPVTDLRPLANLTALKRLYLWDLSPNTSTLDLRPLASLINLEEISLENNKVSDISPLAVLKKLSELHLTNNQIKDISPLAELTELRILWIKGNPVTDLSPLAELNLTDFRSDIDVNEDGVINILDLVAVANAFGKAEPDLNGDGVVNIQDLVIVANAF